MILSSNQKSQLHVITASIRHVYLIMHRETYIPEINTVLSAWDAVLSEVHKLRILMHAGIIPVVMHVPFVATYSSNISINLDAFFGETTLP